jgi:outer membrane protein W
MKRVWMAVIPVVTVLVLPAHARAQARKGDKEIQLSGNTFTVISSGASETVGQFQFGVGYFLTDRLEVGISPIVSITSGSDGMGGTNVTGDLGLSTKVQFFFGEKSAKIKPYVGASYIVRSFKTQGDSSLADNMYVGGNGGFKNYFTERAALDVNVSYGVQPNHPGDFQLLQVNIGITYTF